jgi:hypothetical protein
MNPTNNPNYHASGDKLDTLNLEFLTEVTKVAAAALVMLANE